MVTASQHYSKISFDKNCKVKTWTPPEGLFPATFANFRHETDDKIILYFQIHSIQDPINEYWVRHVYTQNHRATLTKHLLSWLGEKEFRQMIAGGSYNLEQYLEKEALVEVRFTKTVSHKEPLRVIGNIYPHNAPLKALDVVGEFEI